MEFDIGKWQARVLFEPGKYYDLCKYVESSEHLSAHLESREIYSSEMHERKISDIKGERKSMLIEGLTTSVSSAIDTLSRQMIVLAVTLTEGMIGEYAECLFNSHPERMYEYLEINGNKGIISLKTIVEGESKRDIISLLSKKSASKVLEGKFENSLAKVEKISKSSLEKTLKKKLIVLSNLRNIIVHEASSSDIKEHNVKAAYDSMFDLLVWLSKSALYNSVPVVDPGYLVTPRY